MEKNIRTLCIHPKKAVIKHLNISFETNALKSIEVQSYEVNPQRAQV